LLPRLRSGISRRRDCALLNASRSKFQETVERLTYFFLVMLMTISESRDPLRGEPSA